MEKIIYLYFVPQKKPESFFRRMRELLRLTYDWQRKESVFLGIPVTGLAIHGIMNPGEIIQNGIRREQKKWNRTFCKIRKEIDVSAETEVYAQWENNHYVFELILAFVKQKLQEKDKKGFRPEQLIVIETKDYHNEAVRLLSELYLSFNFITVVSCEPEAYEELTEEFYEDSGLLLRSLKDTDNLHFPEKRTVVVDFDEKLPVWYRKLPKKVYYLDFYQGTKKNKVLRRKYGEIAGATLGNALDTMLRNTV